MCEMSDTDKSVLLARARGWSSIGDTIFTPKRPSGLYSSFKNFYDPANMALAWDTHIWAIYDSPFGIEYLSWMLHKSFLAKKDAQHLWLDKILELAIDAGLVEVNDAD